MNEAELADFEKKLEQDAELAAEWADYQIMQRGFEQAKANANTHLDALRSKLRQEGFFESAQKQVEAELAAEQAPRAFQNRPKGKSGVDFWLITGTIIGLAVLIYLNIPSADPTKTVSSQTDQKNQPPANSFIGDSTLPVIPAGAPTTGVASTFPFQQVAGAFITLEVDRYQGAVALKSEGLKKAQPQSPTLKTGFVCQLEGKRYVVTAADNVYGAAYEWGGVIGKDNKGRIFGLKPIGSDAFYNLAVLEMPASPSWDYPVLRWQEQNSITVGAILTAIFPESVSADGQAAMYTIPVQAVRNMGWVAAGVKQPLMTALPVFDAHGNIIGLVNQVGQTVFTQSERKRHQTNGITNSFALQILYTIIQPQQTREPYLGMVFEQMNTGGIRIRSVLPGSPASPYEARLKGIKLDSVQGQPVKYLSDVLMCCRNIRPRSTVRFAGSGENGQRISVNIITKEMTDQYLSVLGTDIVNNLNGFRMINDPGHPKTEYKGAMMTPGVYFIFGAGADPEQSAYNIGSLADLGRRMRAIALQQNGKMMLMYENGGEEPIYFQIHFESPQLWH